MQNDGFGSYEEVEPRSMPKQASNFDSRPFPMVPEVSLIMEKPREPPKQMSNSLANTVSELKPPTRDASYQTSESYATWKEKQFPQYLSKVVSNLPNPIFSSTQNASNLQNTHSMRYSSRQYSNQENADHKDYNCRSHSLDNELPRKNTISKSSSTMENVNQYISSPITKSYNVNHHTNDSYNPLSRFSNEEDKDSQYAKYLREKKLIDEKGETNRKIWSSERRVSDERDLTLTERRKIAEKQQNFLHSQALETYDMNQKSRIHRSSSYPSADTCNHRNIPSEHDQLKHCMSLQANQCNSGHFHNQSGCCTINHSNNNSNNGTETETVRNLLQVITSQNEQIKSLQKQVDRLLKLHEQMLKNRNQCTCQSSNDMYYHSPHFYDQARNSNLPLVQNNLLKENERRFSDLNLQDEKTKKTIVEQKVSIGVMTSFELKVQNNPSLVKDNEKPKSNQEKVKPSLDTSNMIKSLVNDTEEMIRKKHNFFTPTPLENISEGSESHMSSMRQSHLYPDSRRQSIEAQDYNEPPNAQFSKKNFQNNEKLQSDLESTVPINESGDNIRHFPSSNYNEIKDQIYESNTNDIQEAPYQYNFQYGNLHTFPKENVQEENKTDEFNSEPIANDFTKIKNTRFDNIADDCLSLSSSELDVEDLNPPSPEPSIHLDMQEFSSEGGSLPPQQATKVGWTIYNNVLNQVNQILQNSPMNDNRESPDGLKNYEKKEYDNNIIMDTVKAATLEQLTKLGISFSDNLDQRKPGMSKKVMFETPYYQMQGSETHLAGNANVETNTSMHMKALAMKYLNDDQLADITVQKPQPSVLKQVSSLQNTNMSFATMHYLQRYHLLPGNNSSPVKDNIRENFRPEVMAHERLAVKTAERRAPSPRRYPAYTGTSKGSCPSKILDISTLKQQPKLL